MEELTLQDILDGSMTVTAYVRYGLSNISQFEIGTLVFVLGNHVSEIETMHSWSDPISIPSLRCYGAINSEDTDGVKVNGNVFNVFVEKDQKFWDEYYKEENTLDLNYVYYHTGLRPVNWKVFQLN